MTTPDDPNAQGWNAPPPVPPAEGQQPPPYGQQAYGQPPQAPPPYGQPPQPYVQQPAPYPQPGAYPQMGYPAASMDTGIPGSVKTVSVLMFISAGFGILGSLLIIFGASAVNALGAKTISGLLVFFAVIILAISALEIVVGLKIRVGENWARVTGIVLTAISALFQLSQLSRSGGNIIGLALSALILYFLIWEPKAKAFFAAHK
ncbi:MAG: hypothetical protein QOG52_1892 [Frankiaceae bacterium]|jgi:hypothetical protein|nr:hypothetical protein [Frankiaceae bacterium]